MLLTTTYRRKPRRLRGDIYDYARVYVPRLLRPTERRLHAIGLRFLKQNVPEVEILEFPTRAQYVAALARGWDIVGVSFFIDETHEAIEMASLARETGAQVWGG